MFYELFNFCQKNNDSMASSSNVKLSKALEDMFGETLKEALCPFDTKVRLKQKTSNIARIGYGGTLPKPSRRNDPYPSRFFSKGFSRFGFSILILM